MSHEGNTNYRMDNFAFQVGGQAVLGRQLQTATPWLTERHGYDPTCVIELLNDPRLKSKDSRTFCIAKRIDEPNPYRSTGGGVP